MSTPTLTRFYTLHYLLPFVVVVLVVLHIFFLHAEGSTNPLGLNSSSVKVPFHYYYSSKDVVGFLLFLFLLFVVSFKFGYYLMDRENFLLANALVTPAHIQPEWYFLFAYAILRSIPNKLGGVCALLLSILILALNNMISISFVRGASFTLLKRFTF